MTKNGITGAACGIALALLATQASANTIVNGSFENPIITFPFYENFGTGCSANCGGASFAGWTITTNNVDIVSTIGGWPAPAYDGNQFLDLVGYGSTGAISQTFATTPGLSYRLSFAYGNNPGSTSFASATVKVASLNNLFSANFSTTNNIGWQILTAYFTADSTSATLLFDEVVGGNNGGVLLDGINVSATPLPATWTMMLIGFSGFGYLAYRRSKKTALMLS
jgi:uncharacterized protein DUF642/PEP-CTERM motif-containing protein